VSVLRNRIIRKHMTPAAGPAWSHPSGTAATPMVMPLALVQYGGAGAGSYQDMHALATGDVNAVPLAVVTPGSFGRVVPSGRP